MSKNQHNYEVVLEIHRNFVNTLINEPTPHISSQWRRTRPKWRKNTRKKLNILNKT